MLALVQIISSVTRLPQSFLHWVAAMRGTATCCNLSGACVWQGRVRGQRPQCPAPTKLGLTSVTGLAQPVVAQSVPSGKPLSLLGRQTADTICEKWAGVASFRRAMSLGKMKGL